MLLLAVTALAQEPPVALAGARVFPVSSPPIDKAVVVFHRGVITAIGAEGTVAIPADARVIRVDGKVIIPGLVDTHSHAGSDPPLVEKGPTPGVSSIDAIDPTDPGLQRAQAGGITTVNVMPGSGSLIGGQTAYLKLRDVSTVDEMLYCTDRRTEVCGGMKVANGTNPQNGVGPATRMGAALQQREKFLAAQLRMQKLEASGDGKKKSEPPKPLDPDLSLDPLVEVLQKERVVHFHTHRADDIATAISIAEEFALDVVLHHVSEAWKVVDLIAAHDIPCSVIVIDSPGGKEEASEFRAENAALLEAAGVAVAIHSDDPITDSRLFLRSGALAIRAGMTEAGALAALTLNGARMLHLDDRVGSLDVGKDADFAVLSGAPFSVWTHVEQTWAAGAQVFDLADPVDRRYATGGDAVLGRYPEPP